MRSLIIWLPDGKTMKFEDVRDFETHPMGHGKSIKFNYLGVSTQVRRTAVFSISSLMGWALEDEMEEEQ